MTAKNTVRMIDDNYYLSCGPNGRFHVRSKQDRTYMMSIAAFLLVDWVPEASKKELRDAFYVSE